jgi:hypothetical protein
VPPRRHRLTLVALLTTTLSALLVACSTPQDDPPGIDGPAVVDTSVDIGPSPDAAPSTDAAPTADTAANDVATTDAATTTTVGLIDSIDGPVVVGTSTP